MGKRKRLYSYKNKEKRKGEVYAILKNVKISHKKLLPFINLIKGKNINLVLSLLNNSLKIKVSEILKKVIESAILSYKNKKGTKKINEVYVKNIIVGKGLIHNKIYFTGMGKCYYKKKRFSSIKVILN